ncbi:MAG: rRNA pseudouridine synthase [Clostridia bacterium]|nr:rRNA pseudouridine synthase [Clostridia bacterium]MBQ2091684.1 rRNA pseudouridine synthase [Clostridia bacterium]MBQ2499930.1 rRNA pseudouridine synthase [Clostridia bacterium]
MRLDRLISSQGRYSRNEVKKLIRDGLVTVNGEKAPTSDIQVDPAVSEVVIAGEPFIYREHVYLMLNKPEGVVSATDDRLHRTVLDLVPPEYSRPGLFPAGRLDADTTGFVLITDDGDFAHRILSPKNHVEKTYIAELTDPITDEDVEKLEAGIVLKDGFECLPSKIKVLEERKIEIKICEGKYHQIKRMLAATGNRVLVLKRTKIGGLPLDIDLLPGKCREITQEELDVITT